MSKVQIGHSKTLVRTGECDCMAAVKHRPLLNYSVFFSCSLGSSIMEL